MPIVTEIKKGLVDVNLYIKKLEAQNEHLHEEIKRLSMENQAFADKIKNKGGMNGQF